METQLAVWFWLSTLSKYCQHITFCRIDALTARLDFPRLFAMIYGVIVS